MGLELLTTKSKEEMQTDIDIYPGRASLVMMNKIPPVVIFTSEFDNLRRDAYLLKAQCEKVNKLLDFHDMPRMAHGYVYFGHTKES